MSAAAACVVALVVTLMIRPTAPTSGAAQLPAPIAMQAVVAGPMKASVQLVDRQWGTSIIVNCEYAGAPGDAHPTGEGYQLVVFDKSGKAQQAGHWTSVSGTGSTVWTSSSLRLSQISRVEVQWPDGRTVLTAVPPHA